MTPVGRVFVGSDLERPNVQLREILVFVVGIVLATVLTVLGTFYFLKN
jgi:hypothetical protein